MAPFGFVPGITLFLFGFKVVLWYFQFVHFKELRRNAQGHLFLFVFSFANRAEPRASEMKQRALSLREGGREGFGAGPTWLQVWSLLLTSCTAVSPSVEWAQWHLPCWGLKWGHNELDWEEDWSGDGPLESWLPHSVSPLIWDQISLPRLSLLRCKTRKVISLVGWAGAGQGLVQIDDSQPGREELLKY